jgi:predicted transcriptional regulator
MKDIKKKNDVVNVMNTNPDRIELLCNHVINDLKDIREREEVTTSQLEDMTGIKQPNITRMEVFSTIPNLRTVVMIADVLGYDVKLVKRQK